MNKILIKLGVTAGCLLWVIGTTALVKHYKAQADLYCSNQNVLMDSVHHYKTKDSLNAVEVGRLQLSNTELKNYNSELAARVKSLKTGKVESVSQTQSVTILKTKVAVKDTVYLDKTVEVPVEIRVKRFTYKDNFTELTGVLYKDSASLNLKTFEELTVVSSQVKKKFLGIKLPVWLVGYKNKKLDVVSSNPNTVIKNTTFIEIK